MSHEMEASEYVGFFECFNSQKFFEAHEVLEKLWLPNRQASNGRFYQGLIQLAGAFVHVQKGRPGPAASLLKSARANLKSYPDIHERLDVASVVKLIDIWLHRQEGQNPAEGQKAWEEFPSVRLIESVPSKNIVAGQ